MLYDNSKTVTDENQILSDFQKMSQATYEQHHHIADLQYDFQRRSTLDFFPTPVATNTTVIFIHGGYWQWCEKRDFAFVADFVLKQHAQCVLVEYDLAPQSSLNLINLQIRKALDYIHKQTWISSNVIVVGHSAGAHLAALNLDHPLIDSAVLLSGIYDLKPIQETHLNKALNLSELDIKNLSPVEHSTHFAKPCTIAYGLDELPELKCQSQKYYQIRQQLEPEFTHLLSFVDTNHYSILERYFQSIMTT